MRITIISRMSGHPNKFNFIVVCWPMMALIEHFSTKVIFLFVIAVRTCFYSKGNWLESCCNSSEEYDAFYIISDWFLSGPHNTFEWHWIGKTLYLCSNCIFVSVESLMLATSILHVTYLQVIFFFFQISRVFLSNHSGVKPSKTPIAFLPLIFS